jgi:hypothetical protein
MSEPVPRCEVCEDRIDIDADPDCLVQAPDYMPADFRRRTRMLMCDSCRVSDGKRQM